MLCLLLDCLLWGDLAAASEDTQVTVHRWIWGSHCEAGPPAQLTSQRPAAPGQPLGDNLTREPEPEALSSVFPDARLSENSYVRDSRVVRWLRLCAPNAQGLGS